MTSAQTHNYFGTTGTLNGSSWSTNPSGPYTSALNATGGATINFGNVTASVTGGTITVAGINATANTTLTAVGGTIGNFGNGIVPINVLGGVTLDFSSQGFTTSGSAGYRKDGDGVLALAGGTYGGGFTLNAGTVVVRGVNAFGSGGALRINGGTIAASTSRDLSGKFAGGIIVGGDFTFGSTTGVASPNAILTFSNDVALGASTRKITLGGTGTYTLGGGISGAGGLTVDATAQGALILAGVNTYQGPTTIQAGTVRFAKRTALYNGVPANWSQSSLIVHAQASAIFNVGGADEFEASDITAILLGTGFQASANLILDTANASGGKFVQSLPLAEPNGQPVNLVKDGFGMLALGADNVYSGQTIIRSGTLQIGDGAAAGNLGSSSGVVNSGSIRVQRVGELVLPQPISGTGSFVHAGTGTTKLIAAQSYTGTTSVIGGTLAFAESASHVNAGSLLVSGAGGAVLDVQTSGTLSFNNSFTIGNVDQSGAVIHSSGTLNLINSTNYLTAGAGGYGSYTLAGGALNVTGGTGIRVGATAASGQGVFNQTGGTLSLSRTFAIGQGGGTGVATVTGGNISTSTGYGFVIGESGTGSGTLNVGTQAGGDATIVSQASTTSPGLIIGSGAPGTVNLNSGLLRVSASSIRKGSAAAALNLNGGTIQAGAPSLTMIENSVPTTIYRGGAVFDTQTHTATVAANLAPAAGNGLYPAGGAISLSAGAGYIAAPLVTISGGTGTGATAVAEVTGGIVTAVKITSPGQNYSTGDFVTFQFSGGGAPTNAFAYTLTSADVASNATGGLTKVGTGTLHLTGTNTYTGDTECNSGTLLVSGSVSGSTIRVAPGATLAGAGTIRSAVIAEGARLTPGNGPGTLTIMESLILESGSILTMQLTGANQAPGGTLNDLIITASLALRGTVNITESVAGSFLTASVGDTWKLFQYSELTAATELVLGSTPNLPQGLSFTIDTSPANHVDLVVVPEPTVSIALFVGFGLLLGTRRRTGITEN